MNGNGDVRPAYACGDALCPCCRGRRERISHKYISGLPSLLAAHDGDVVSACFTVQNVAAPNLKQEIVRINTSFTGHFLRAMRYRAGTPSYIKKLEVTRAVDGKAHPHIHSMLALPRGWTETNNVMRMWQHAGRMRYTPDVYWRRIQPERTGDAVRELTYILKQPLQVNREMLNDPAFILAAATSLAGVRTTAAGGAFREFAARRLEKAVPEGALDGIRLEWTGTEYRRFARGTVTHAVKGLTT
jgi:Replication protein